MSGEPGALLVIETLPVKLLAEAGAKLTVKEVFCPALRVAGTDKPLIRKALPETVACEMVALAVPEFVRTMVTDPVLPTTRPPKLTLDGLALNVAWVPVPLIGIVKVEFAPLLVMVTTPDVLPVTEGANCTVKEVLCPGKRVNGTLSPAMLNPAPVTVA